MRLAFTALALGLAAFVPVVAEADEVHGTRYLAKERVHSIDAKIGRGHAVLVVTRIVENSGPKSDQAVFWLDVPDGSVATRLRTAGTTTAGAPIWFEGELMEAEAAAKKYKELTGVGGYYPKDPALLSWRSRDRLALQVFPVPARSTKTVEYTLKLPLQYESGRYVAKLAPLGTTEAPAKIRFSPATASDVVEVNGVRVGPESTVTASRELEIVLHPKGAPPVDGALASYGFAPDRNLVHARFAAAPKLSEAPARSSVVVLVDTSRSMEGKVETAYAAAAAYIGGLAQSPGADVEVMTFARKPSSPFGGPLPAATALAKLYSLPHDTANGSNLDLAIERADAKLAASIAPAKRILLITDLRTREALTAPRVKPLASGAVLHVATVEQGMPALTRDDEDPWAMLPRKTGGLLWRASVGASQKDAASVFEEWIRPKRIDRFALQGMPEGSIEIPTSLAEGDGLASFGIQPKAVTKVTMSGELWSRPWKMEVAPSAEEAKLWAALVFGSDLEGQLDEKEQMTLAMHGRAVSPVTSYLAIEPGVRPSTEGLEEHESIGFGSGTGTGQGFGNGHGRLGGTRHRPVDRESFLRTALEAAMAKCNVSGETTATVETTSIEIVDLREVAAAPRQAKNETCIGEEMWTLKLPTAFDEPHATFRIRAKR